MPESCFDSTKCFQISLNWNLVRISVLEILTVKIKYNLNVSQHFKLKWLKIFSYPHMVGCSHERKHREHFEAQLLLRFIFLQSMLPDQHFLSCTSREERAHEVQNWACPELCLLSTTSQRISGFCFTQTPGASIVCSNIALYFNFPARSLKHSTRKLQPYYNLFNSAFSTNSFQRKLLSHY